MYRNFTAFYLGIWPAAPAPSVALPPGAAPEGPGAAGADEPCDAAPAGGAVPAGGTVLAGGTELAGGTDDPEGAEPGTDGTDEAGEAGVVTPSMRLPDPLGR